MSDLRPEQKSGHTLLVDIWSEVAVLRTNVNHILDAQGRADASRGEIHQKLDGFNRVADTVARMEPIVTTLNELRLRQAGARSFGYWLGRATWAVIGSAIALAVELLHSINFTGRH